MNELRNWSYVDGHMATFIHLLPNMVAKQLYEGIGLKTGQLTYIICMQWHNFK